MKTLAEKSYFALVQSKNAVVAFNSPNELVKWSSAHDQPLPQVIVVGDTPVDEGVDLVDPEFVVMNQMFMAGGYDFASASMVAPIYLVGTKKRVDALLEAFQLSLTGPTKEEYKDLGKHKHAKQLLAESEHMALKNSDKEVHPALEFCRPVHFDENGLAEISALDLEIHHRGKDTYTVKDCADAQVIELKKAEPWVPSWDIPILHGVESPSGSRVSVIGCDSPFGPKSTSNFLFELQGRKIMFDAAPYSTHVLRANGYQPSDIDVIIVSHIHADHVGGMFEYATNSKKKIEIWATREVQYSLIKKLKALWDMSERRVRKYFRWKTISVDKPAKLFGYQFDFHYGVHPIPTIGVTLSHGGRHLLTITGDTGFSNLLDGFLEAGIISKQRYDSIVNLPKKGLTFADAGEAMIHGTPEELTAHDAANLMIYHTSSLKEEFQGKLNLLEAGQVYNFESADTSAHDTAVITQILSRMGLTNGEEWATVLQADAIIETRPAGQLLIEKGSNNADSAFFITHGIVDVEIDEMVVASLGTGEYFGEQAIFQPVSKRSRNASIRSKSQTRLLRIPGPLFQEMIAEDSAIAKSEGREDDSVFNRFQTVWSNRAILSAVPQFQGLSATVINDLSLKLREIEVSPGGKIVKEGSHDDNAYIVAEGSVDIWKSEAGWRPIRLATPVLVGENVSLGFEDQRNADVVAAEHCKVFIISGDDFRALHNQVPLVRSNIERTAQARGQNIEHAA